MTDQPTEVRFVNAEVLRIGPDDALIVIVPPDVNDEGKSFGQIVAEHLDEIGLTGRSLVITSEAPIEMAVAPRDNPEA